MPYFTSTNIKVDGIATAVPSTEVILNDLITDVNISEVTKYQKTTGIKSFRVSKKNQTASDLGFSAAKHLISKLEVNTSEIGVLIFVSHSTDYRRPATSFVLHKRLNLSNDCIVFDINLGCSAYVYGINVILSILNFTSAYKGLLICAETVTKLSNSNDKTTSMLFGDAGTATLFSKSNEESIITGSLHSDGKGYKSIIAPAGGFRNMYADNKDKICRDGNSRNLYNIFMNGGEVFDFTITKVPEMINQYLVNYNYDINSYDAIVLHQANLFIMKQIARKINADVNKLLISIDRYGNTSAASLGLTLCDQFGSVDDGVKKVLISGFGIGLSYGVVSLSVDTAKIFEIIISDEVYDEGKIDNPLELL